jgi:ribonucleotide monophosphatase NagD (HAD superfamily)
VLITKPIDSRGTYSPAFAERSGLPEELIWTSALATAAFLADHPPGGSAYAVGEAGMMTALYEIGYTLTERDDSHRSVAAISRRPPVGIPTSSANRTR